MSELYSLVDKKRWIHQPNFTRWNHRYRGVRESLKINTEIHQAYYDLYRLEERADDILDYLEEKSELLTDGGYIDGVEFQISDDATPGISPMYLMGLDDMITTIENLRNRTKDLER